MDNKVNILDKPQSNDEIVLAISALFDEIGKFKNELNNFKKRLDEMETQIHKKDDKMCH